MNHVLSETYQIDSVIQPIQTSLYTDLIERWETDKLDAYGRVYKNESETGTIPEIYDAEAKKYFEVYYDKQSCFFFIDGDEHTTEDEHQFKTSLKIAFMLNLGDLKTSGNRVDADVQRDALELVRKLNGEFTIQGIEKGIDNVFRGFKTDMIQFEDMQPFHVFAITGEISYFINDKCD